MSVSDHKKSGSGTPPEATQFIQAQAGCAQSLNQLMTRHDGLVQAVVRQQVICHSKMPCRMIDFWLRYCPRWAGQMRFCPILAPLPLRFGEVKKGELDQSTPWLIRALLFSSYSGFSLRNPNLKILTRPLPLARPF